MTITTQRIVTLTPGTHVIEVKVNSAIAFGNAYGANALGSAPDAGVTFLDAELN